MLSPREIARGFRAEAEETRELVGAAVPNETDERHHDALSDSRTGFGISVASRPERPYATARVLDDQARLHSI